MLVTIRPRRLARPASTAPSPPAPNSTPPAASRASFCFLRQAASPRARAHASCSRVHVSACRVATGAPAARIHCLDFRFARSRRLISSSHRQIYTTPCTGSRAALQLPKSRDIARPRLEHPGRPPPGLRTGAPSRPCDGERPSPSTCPAHLALGILVCLVYVVE